MVIRFKSSHCICENSAQFFSAILSSLIIIIISSMKPLVIIIMSIFFEDFTLHIIVSNSMYDTLLSSWLTIFVELNLFFLRYNFFQTAMIPHSRTQIKNKIPVYRIIFMHLVHPEQWFYWLPSLPNSFNIPIWRKMVKIR